MSQSLRVIFRGNPRFLSFNFFHINMVIRLAICYLLAFVITVIIVTSAFGISPNGDQAIGSFIKLPTSYEIIPLTWSNELSKNPPEFFYPKSTCLYMRRLNESYNIAQMTARDQSEIEKVITVCNWVNQQWKHHGDCPKQQNDPIGILEAARNGSQFSCYEYSMVTAGCLNSIGIKSRIVVLLSKSVEYRNNGSYHVVAEAYLKDMKRWVMVDAQFNAVATLNNHPLSIVGVQVALAKNLSGIEFGNLNELLYEDYYRDMQFHLFFLYTPFDNRPIGPDTNHEIEGGVMLLPLGVTSGPRSFAGAPVERFITTNSLPNFYRLDLAVN